MGGFLAQFGTFVKFDSTVVELISSSSSSAASLNIEIFFMAGHSATKQKFTAADIGNNKTLFLMNSN